MRTDLYIAKRLYFKASEDNNQTSYSDSTAHARSPRTGPAVRVALWGMVIGVLVMIVTIFIVVGFKQTIRDKVSGFGAHIQVVNFDNNSTYEMKPISIHDTLIQKIRSVEGVTCATPFATKPGMIKTADAFQAIIFKGSPLLIPPTGGRTPAEGCIASDNAIQSFPPMEGTEGGLEFFSSNLISGQMPQKRNEVIISRELGRMMHLDVDSTFYCYFIQEQIRVRRFTISGIYNTDFSEYDSRFIIGDITQVQQLNGWDSTQVSGIECLVDDFNKLDEITNRVYFRTANQEDANGNFLYTQNIQQTNPAIFSWLDLLDMNVVVIIVLMLCVAGICMCSGLIILILEGIQFIGVMKALGASNGLIRRIYLWQAAFLIGRGMLVGNIIGLALCAFQYFFHLVPLDPTAYYVSYVPITFAWGWWAVLNIGAFVVSMLIMLLPSIVVTKISPAQVMRYE